MDMPDRIWAQPSGMFGEVRVGTYADTIRHAGGTQYVRMGKCRAAAIELLQYWANTSDWDSHADMERFLMHLKRARGKV